MTPVLLLYPMPVPAESDEEASLLLKLLQSVEERYPLVEAFAWLMLKPPVLELYASGALAENEASEARPREEVAVRVYVEPLPTRIWP